MLRPTLAAFDSGHRAPRQRNRIIMVCTALFEKDTPQWPFWKFQHIKNTRRVTDFAMLAITRQDSFVASIQNGVASTRTLRRNLKTLDTKLLRGFLDTWYRPNSYFVYGGHGCSNLLEFDDDYRMQVHELADALGDRQFLGMLFDACVMASLDTAYYLRKNTPVIGAAEGWMWEEDTWGENHMFNPYAASLMSRDANARRVMQRIGEEYTSKSRLADFSVIETTHAEALWNRVQEKHWNQINESVQLKPNVASGEAPVESQKYESVTAPKYPSDVLQAPVPFDQPAVTASGVIVPRDHIHRTNFTFPNALYPQQWDEDHIVDLGSFLRDDAESTDLLKRVVPWHAGPSDAALYDVRDLSGMNIALGQYSYQSASRPLVAAVENAPTQRTSKGKIDFTTPAPTTKSSSIDAAPPLAAAPPTEGPVIAQGTQARTAAHPSKDENPVLSAVPCVTRTAPKRSLMSS